MQLYLIVKTKAPAKLYKLQFLLISVAFPNQSGKIAFPFCRLYAAYFTTERVEYF
jgi:hypothetical protein